MDETKALVRIAIFEIRPVVAEGLAALLAECDGIDIVGATSHLDEMMRMIAEADVQVVVFGIEDQTTEHVRETASRFSAAARIAQRNIGLVGVVPGGQEAADRCSSADLPTVVTTEVSPNSLRNAILTACPGGRSTLSLRLVRPQVTAAPRPVKAEARIHLTQRERAVLHGIEQGMSTREIAEALGITANTVRTHVQHLLPKLGVHSRLQAAALASDAPADGDERP